MSQSKRLVVIGGGLSGLAYVHYLRTFLLAAQKTHLVEKVILLESSNHMGGSTKTHSYNDGPLHELGPRSIRFGGVKSYNTVALIESLGLEDKVVKADKTSAAARNRYFYRHGKLHRVPIGLKDLLKKFPGGETRVIRAMYRDMFEAKKINLDNFPYQDPTVYEFVSHRFGEDAADCMADPILRGITAGDIRRLSAKSILPAMLEAEQASGNVMRGIMNHKATKLETDDLFPNDLETSKLLEKFTNDKVSTYNLSTGIQTIAQRLSDTLLNTNEDNLIEIYNQSQVVALNFEQENTGEGPCSVGVKTIDGDIIQINCHHVASGIASVELAKILPPTTPLETKLALEFVTNIPHVPVGCVTVEYRKLKEPSYLNSFGLLTHSKEGCRVLGISFDSSLFPEIDRPHKSTRMTCMIGGQWFEEMTGTKDVDKVTNAQLEQISLEEIEKILNITAEPHRMTTHLWKTGIAQYERGHVDRLKTTRAELDKLGVPLTLLGQSYDGVAVNDVLFNARMAANKFVKWL